LIIGFGPFFGFTIAVRAAARLIRERLRLTARKTG
jgi:hypothetical protein